MADKYRSFLQLSASEREGIDYRICLTARPSAVAVVAPHGGEIEPGTSQLALAIAGDEFSSYCFEGIIPGRPHGDLHIRSELFDEPKGREVVIASEIAVGIHGRKDREDPETVLVGGKHAPLRDAIVAALRAGGFKAAADTESEIAGLDSNNICNRGKSGRGAQLEIPRTLRRKLIDDRDKFLAFVEAVREAIRSIASAA